MNLLALDTSTPTAALAVARSDGATLAAGTDPALRHGRGLVPAIRDLLRRAGLAPADLDGLAVGLGPGSYTGLRVGITAAKTLAYATDRPLIGLDSLEVLARNAPPEAPRIAVVADAQRGDLYAADFARDRPGLSLTRLGPTRIVSTDEWVRCCEPGTIVLGPAVERLGTRLPAGSIAAEARLNVPIGEHLAELAREVWATGRRDDLWALEPSYLRRSAAEDQWKKA